MIKISCSELISYMKNYMTGISVEQRIYLSVLSVLFFVIMLFALIYQEERMTWWKVFGIIVLAVLISAISIVTLTGRNPKADARWMWKPFWSYVAVVEEKNVALLTQIIWNILIFVPIGLFLPVCFQTFKRYRYIFLTVFVMTGTIEVIQGLKKIGLFEVDDMMNNLLGTAIGVGLYALGKKIARELTVCKNICKEKTTRNL